METPLDVLSRAASLVQPGDDQGKFRDIICLMCNFVLYSRDIWLLKFCLSCGSCRYVFTLEQPQFFKNDFHRIR